MKRPSVAKSWMLTACVVPLLMTAVVAGERSAIESAEATTVQSGANSKSPKQSAPKTPAPNSDIEKAKDRSGQAKSLRWAEVIEAAPDPGVVTDAVLRDAIVKTGLPWRVSDKGTGIEMVLIPPGEFVMGKSPGDDEADNIELPAHEVKLTKAFYLGRYEVTQLQYAKVMGTNPSEFAEYTSAENDPAVDAAMKTGWTRKEAEQAAKQRAAKGLGVRGLAKPVESLSWRDCDEFCKKTKLRLPTEAEWEYACRAGQRTPRYRELDEIAWHGSNSEGTTHAVGTKKANGFGLYDMLGNVLEWVNDYYGAYSAAEQTNPQGPSSGSYRVLRGGSWGVGTGGVRSSARSYVKPDFSYVNMFGFRASRTP